MTLQPFAYTNDRPKNDRARRRTILLVEDEPFVREATCSILESAGFEVLPAEDAQDAMKVYEECKRGIDLVITDMVLPGRTGQQLGQDLREHSPEVAVLVTSGYSNPEPSSAIFAAGDGPPAHRAHPQRGQVGSGQGRVGEHHCAWLARRRIPSPDDGRSRRAPPRRRTAPPSPGWRPS